MIPCFALFLLGVGTCLVTGNSLVWALSLGLVLFSLLALRRGYQPRQVAAMAWEKGREALIVVPVFLIIGAVTALWRASGTISFFLYYGLRAIPPAAFVAAAFLLAVYIKKLLLKMHLSV